ncbi:carboxypeptidase-like regulatory domain-containing protein [Adhaeribacter swui]|uniref:Carboxypeptidase-like regulatory domain-containing protein n=1 Tax=Adhaeribacter swui TaxID=2086471 RepID=A0A7G7G8F2_9BACT|nr:carboxypeptidase-like regulatory domain-containing protein [Adhaeribacter swui]QNF33436.1 carboxypeptidase-like regulatory domain-containing protein [Adhaeribacter swui]
MLRNYPFYIQFLKNTHKVVLLGLLFGFGFLLPGKALAQGKSSVVQLSGVVASGDSLYGVPGVTVYVPKAGRGTVTNEYGYFSMPVLAGDSVVVRALGFKHLTLKIPKNYNKQSYSVVLELKEDATLLPEVRVFPYPTEELFKKAFLALRVPDEQKTAAEKNLNEQLMARIFDNTPVGPSANFRNTMDMQQMYLNKQSMPNRYNNNPLLNPFAWGQLINQIKNGDLKRKYKDD